MDDAIRIATEVADALDYAHRQDVIHRDIKPGNILLHEGRVLVADFGIALAVGAAGGGHLTETGLSLGTPHYMSPEQATGDQNVGPQTDTYALGCVLYEMLVGEPPYTGPNAQAVLGQIIIADPVSAAKKRASIPPNVWMLRSERPWRSFRQTGSGVRRSSRMHWAMRALERRLLHPESSGGGL